MLKYNKYGLFVIKNSLNNKYIEHKCTYMYIVYQNTLTSYRFTANYCGDFSALPAIVPPNFPQSSQGGVLCPSQEQHRLQRRPGSLVFAREASQTGSEWRIFGSLWKACGGFSVASSWSSVRGRLRAISRVPLQLWLQSVFHVVAFVSLPAFVCVESDGGFPVHF